MLNDDEILTLPRFIEAMYEIVNKGYDNHELSFDTDESLRECVCMHRDGNTAHEGPYQTQSPFRYVP